MHVDGFFSEPTIAGGRLALVCDGAVWECSVEGGVAVRRTTRFRSIGAPQLRASDACLAFAASTTGAPQLRVAVRGSTRSRQLTFEAESCRALWWAGDGRIAIATAARSVFPQCQSGWLIDPDTGSWQSLNSDAALPVSAAGTSPRLAGIAGVNPRFWRGYRGGARSGIAIDVAGDGRFTPLTSLAGNTATPVWYAGRAYFISDADGAPNLYSCARDGDAAIQHTHDRQWAVHSPASDGQILVYCRAGSIFRHDVIAGDTEISITLDRPVTGRRVTRRTVEGDITLVQAPSRAERVTCIAMRTLIEATPHQSCQSARRLLERCSWARGTADGALVAIEQGDRRDRFVRIGEHRALVFTEPGSDVGRVVAAAAATDGSRIVIANNRHELIAVTLPGGVTTMLDRSEHRPIGMIDLSPDGTFCAYVFPVGVHRTVVRIARCDGSGIVAESVAQFADGSPRFLSDGVLVFLSLQRKSHARGEMITTVVRWQAPFAPTASSMTRVGTASHLFSAAIPLPGIGVILCDASAASEFEEVSNAGTPTPLWRVRADDIVATGRDRLVLQSGNAFHSVSYRQGRPTIGRAITALQALRVPVDPPTRWRDAVAFVGRLASDELPVRLLPDEWNELRDAYTLQAQRACSAQDVVAISNELLGHLGLSHAHVAPTAAPLAAAAQGALGVDVALLPTRGWQVAAIPRGDPQSAAMQGLADASLQLRVGDRIASVNGRRLSRRRSPGAALQALADHRVSCELIEPATGQRRSVTFTAARSERANRYAAWVHARREYVREISLGRVAYLHLRDVSEDTRAQLVDWSSCHEDTRALLLDLRFNEGGSLASEIAAFLSRAVFACISTRWSVPHRVPAAAGIDRITVLVNRFTTSGGELLAAALREHSAVRIVGERSFGAAMGNANRHRLPDGSELVLPQLAIETPDSWSTIENMGVVPDVNVDWHGPELWPDPTLVVALGEAVQ